MLSRARKPIATVIGFISVAVLATGCTSPGTGNTQTVTVTETASDDHNAQNGDVTDPAPVSQEQVAAVATFDRNSPDFEFFNICEELTNEDLAKFGLQFRDEPTIDLSVPSSICSFEELGGFDGALGIQYADVNMGVLSEEELLSKVIKLETAIQAQSSISGALFFVQSEAEKGEACEVSAATEKGRLWVGYGTVRSGAMTQDQICEKAYGYFENFYSELEKRL